MDARAKWVGLILGTLLHMTGSASRAMGQSALRISVESSKSEFFEGEPIYVLIRTANVGTDTAWLMPPDLGRRSVVLIATRPDGSTVPELATWVDHYYPESWRGMPLAPGQTRFEVALLQNFLGEGGAEVTPVYHRHINPGPMEIVARLDPNVPTVNAEPLPLISSAPVRITIHKRRPNEEAVYRDVAAVRALAWRGATSQRYARELLALIARRQAADSNDPFLPFLLNEGVLTVDATGIRLDTHSRERLHGMRLGAARAFRESPAGAVTALRAMATKPDEAAAITTLLGESLSSEIVRERRSRGRNPKSN